MAEAQLRGVLHHLASLAGMPALTEAADGDLLARFSSQHDQTAFAVLLRRHGPMVLNVCRRLLRQTEDAEDVFQATFLLLARKAASIRKQGSVGSWLYGVAYRLAFKARARRSLRQAREQRAAQMHGAEAGVKAAWREVQVLLDEALERLPEKYRAALVLCYLEGKSHEEAARQIRCPLATLRSRVARGRDKLRAELARRGLALTAAGFTAFLAANTADAALPAVLLQTTIQAALRFIREEPAAQIVSAGAARLVEGGMRTMLVSKIKLGLLITVTLGLFTAGAGFTAFRALEAEEPSTQQNIDGGKAAEDKPKPASGVIPQPSRELVVQVKDGDGKPVRDAEVYFLAEYRPVAEGRTDAKGRWTGRVPIDAKDTGWAVFARKANLGFDYLVPEPVPGSRDQMRPLPNRVDLTLDGARTLRVKTVDRHGKPIAGVKVGPWYIQKPGREKDANIAGIWERWPATGQDGVVVLDWLPKRFAHALPILAHSDDYFVMDHATSILADKPASELTITLLPMERLSGRVTHSDGRPAAGITVSVQGQGTGPNPFQKSVPTDADGRYTMKVCSEHAYVITVSDKQWAAPYRASIVVRAGKPVDGVDFVLGRATRLHGRVTVGKDGRPVPETYITLVIDKGQIPEELRRKDDRAYHPISMHTGMQTDKDGRFEFHIGPGEYQLRGPMRTEPVKITIPTANPPAEIVRDFQMARPERGTLTGQVVDSDGRLAGGAIVWGAYVNPTNYWFPPVKTDGQGRFKVERCLDPLVLQAETADKTRAGVLRIDAETPKAQITVGPLARASGRLLDLAGKPLARKELQYRIRIDLNDAKFHTFTYQFGGKVMTDAEGRFTLTGLVPGETYHLHIQPDEHSFRTVKEITAKDPKPLDLGDLRVDPEPPRPYVPPTPAQRAADAFSPAQKMLPRQRMEKVLAEARREYTRPLLLFGRPKDPACVDLFRLFHEEPKQADAGRKDQIKGESRPPSPYDLRWEFELASLDTDQPAVRRLAEELGVPVNGDRPPILAVLTAEGVLAATHALPLDAKHKLDSPSLTAFLLKHKLATRDAERMLAQALSKAIGENKQVFFIASASWCGPCRLLSRFLAAHKAELERHYVFVKIDISRDTHADSVCKRLQGGKAEGVPWYAILDAEGKARITSNAPGSKPGHDSTNIGFPSSPEDIEHFLNMLKQTAPRLSGEQLTELRKALTANK